MSGDHNMHQKPVALEFADELYRYGSINDPNGAADELRRLHEEIEALREANEAFGKRQEWWNDRMFDMETSLAEARKLLQAYVEVKAKDAALLRQALEALERGETKLRFAAITALRERIRA